MELPSETCRASSLQKYNKLYIVACCWTVIDIVAVSSLMGRGSNASRGQDIFLFSKTSRPVLGPTQLPVKWVSKFLPGPKRLGCEVDHSLPVELYIFSFIRAFMAWTGKSLPFLQGSIGPACVSILPITRCLELH